MPITIQVPEGLFPSETEDELASLLTDEILRVNGASGNPLARRHLIVAVTRVAEGKLYAGGIPEPFVNVALQVPTFSLDAADKRAASVTFMTDAIEKAERGRLERDRIYINMLYGDGFWGVGGVALTDQELLIELERASHPPRELRDDDA